MKRRRKKLLDPNTVVLLKHIGIGILVLGSVALLITGIWYGTRLPALTITTVKATGGETIRATTVEQLVQDTLAGEYLHLVPRRFAWLYPEKEIYEKVSQVPRLHNVHMSRSDGNTLHITYDEYVPRALWCTEVESEDCVFLDAKGYAFAEAPELTGGSFLRFVTTNRENAVGATLVEQTEFDSLRHLVDLLAAQGWFISSVELDQNGDAYLKVVDGGEFKVATADEPEQIVGNLVALLASDEFADLKPGNFQYIDLRFGNKVYVNEELAVPEAEAASSSQD